MSQFIEGSGEAGSSSDGVRRNGELIGGSGAESSGPFSIILPTCLCLWLQACGWSSLCRFDEAKKEEESALKEKQQNILFLLQKMSKARGTSVDNLITEYHLNFKSSDP